MAAGKEEVYKKALQKMLKAYFNLLRKLGTDREKWEEAEKSPSIIIPGIPMDKDFHNWVRSQNDFLKLFNLKLSQNTILSTAKPIFSDDLNLDIGILHLSDGWKLVV
jgi:hypothetical protein